MDQRGESDPQYSALVAWILHECQIYNKCIITIFKVITINVIVIKIENVEMLAC